MSDPLHHGPTHPDSTVIVGGSVGTVPHLVQPHPWSTRWHGGRTRSLRSVTLAMALLTTVTVLAEPILTAPTPAPQSGWIDSFDGPASGYGIRRDGETLEVRYFMPLLEGDRVLVREADGLIHIRLGEESPRSIDRDHSPFAVPAAGTPPTIRGNLIRWASDWFTELHDEHARRRPIQAISKGEPTAGLTSGLLFPETVKLAAGQRPLALGWCGGRPPFSVRLVADGGSTVPLFEQSGIATGRVRSTGLDLRPGRYLLSIRDAQGATLETTLTVVAPEQVPRPDPTTIPTRLPAAVQRNLGAAWLASQDGGWVWRLEAWQGLTDTGGYAPAELLREALLADSELPAPLATGD